MDNGILYDEIAFLVWQSGNDRILVLMFECCRYEMKCGDYRIWDCVWDLWGMMGIMMRSVWNFSLWIQ